jgi:hypothetical protein
MPPGALTRHCGAAAPTKVEERLHTQGQGELTLVAECRSLHSSDVINWIVLGLTTIIAVMMLPIAHKTVSCRPSNI